MNNRDGVKPTKDLRKQHRLALYVDRHAYHIDREPGLPTKPEVVYTRPNPDGSRKQCRNCVLWLKSAQQCYIFDEYVVVPPDAICNYHVYGNSPQLKRPADLEPVDSYEAGFMQAKQGTSCDRCEHYTATSQEDGVCSAVVDLGGAPAVVQSHGCCARFESK